MRRRHPILTKQELHDFADQFFRNWAHLDELEKIRLELEQLREMLEERLTFLAIQTTGGGPRA